jgi:predicted nucleic acid-binding protein
VKVLIDTNIILDFCLSRERYKYAKAIFEATENNKIKAILGAQSIPTVYFYLQQELNHIQAVEFIKDISQKFVICDLTLKIIQDSVKLEFSDYDDALLADTAFKESCDYIITNNVKDFKKSKVNAIRPVQFIKEFL